MEWLIFAGVLTKERPRAIKVAVQQLEVTQPEPTLGEIRMKIRRGPIRLARLTVFVQEHPAITDQCVVIGRLPIADLRFPKPANRLFRMPQFFPDTSNLTEGAFARIACLQCEKAVFQRLIKLAGG